MAAKLITIQTPAGHGSASLLSAELYPNPETSGTAFFCFGLAWGLNNAILDQATCGEPTVRAWNALVGHVHENGMLGYVQAVGSAPKKTFKDKTEVYGSGAFLAAGSEIYKLSLK